MSPFFRRHFVWIILGVVLLGWLLSSGGIRNYFLRLREYRRLDARRRETKQRVAEKQVRLNKAMKDESFLELEARRHLGLVRPDEIEYRFVASTGASPSDQQMIKTFPAPNNP
ncbi:MAG TPA: septum formation initiator family protein [Elusimicrobiota bacterium]|nr:septum formation initiator family protein [Elusimicrobiota bacterium]